MAPKPQQATLGYVKSSQRTLGNFFGKPSGSKPEGQQSKLSFSSKSSKRAPKKEDVDDEVTSGATAENDTNGATKHENDADVKMEDASPPVKEEDAKEEGTVKQEPMSSGAKKRPASTEPADSPAEDEDAEEPPTKKQRQKPGANGTAKKGVAMKVSSRKVERSATPPNEDEDEVAAKSKSPKRKPKVEAKASPEPARKKAKQTGSKEEDEEGTMRSHTAATNHTDDVTNAADEGKATYSNEGSESEPEDSEDEQPEAAAKAREKVQSTLKASGKDPYPDWKAGEPVPYAALCTTFSKIEMTTKRLEIMAHCSLFMRQVLRLTPNDLLPTVLLMIGKLAADYSGIELGIGESLIMKAIGDSTGRSLAIIKEDQRKIGDLGLVAAKSRQNQPTMFKPKPLTVRGVHESLLKIASVEGQGGQGRKVDGIKKLLSAADTNLAKGQGIDIDVNKGGPSEAKFIIRALEGKMRLGLADKSVQVSLAHAMVAHGASVDGRKVPSDDELKKGEETFKSVYNELPAYEVIIPALLKGGIWKLRDECKLQPGVPLKPMLAKPTKSITEVLDRFTGKDFTCEYKYDGERAQIHFVAHDAKQDFAATVAPQAGKTERGISNIFSRNSEDLSKKYPDILGKLPTWVKQGTKSFVLDCETVAWDVEKKTVLPFQQLMTRKKKDVKVEDIKVKVCVFAFDLLFLNGDALVNKPFRERRGLLHEAFEEIEGEFSFAQFGNSKDIEEIQVLLDQSISASCEGLMVKMLDGVESHYEPSRRSQNWLKVKKDYLSGAGDSLDLVVLGAYYGKGKRTSVYGAFCLACYNPTTENYEFISKIGTGFSEELLETLYNDLSPITIDRAKPFYDHSPAKNEQPDVWFEPRFVWEVKTADLTLSPKYRAAHGEFGKGVSLRFPRLLRVRDDKKPDEATTSRQVAEMYRKQEAVGKGKGPSVDDEFEY
ncbi:hypothetical protein MBLNU230_g4925t1 [Neophaeotheca triangularis]